MAGEGGFVDFVARTARHRMDEAADVGVELVATACPVCLETLGEASGGTGIRVRDVVDLLADSVRG